MSQHLRCVAVHTIRQEFIPSAGIIYASPCKSLTAITKWEYYVRILMKGNESKRRISAYIAFENIEIPVFVI